MKNIVLTGFMGTGKTTIGQEVARQLDRSFVDLDNVIEARQGCSIRQIFEQDGEAHFRKLEADLCREAAIWENHVIATGGGALVNAENLAVLAAQNLVICLDCEPNALWERLAAATDRPLLDSADRKERILSLLQARQPAYAKIPHHVDTTHLTTDEISAEIISLYNHQQTNDKNKGQTTNDRNNTR